jgi:hypothetical protein
MPDVSFIMVSVSPRKYTYCKSASHSKGYKKYGGKNATAKPAWLLLH